MTLTAIDRHAPIMLGNGDLGFTADITGLQTFPEQYSELAPLLTMAQWAWHSFPNPEGYTEQNGLVNVPVPGRGEQPYAWMKSWADAETNPAYTWLRANPHRISLSRIGLTFNDGRALDFAKVANMVDMKKKTAIRAMGDTLSMPAATISVRMTLMTP